MKEIAPWENDLENEIAPWDQPTPSVAPQPRPMSKQELESYNHPITLEGLGRGTLEALPIAGSIAGGFIGSLPVFGGPGVGTVAGSAAGGMAGKSLEQFGKDVFFGERKPIIENIKDIGKEGVYSALGEIGGQAVGKGISKVAEKIPGALTKIGSSLTGISENEIKVYAKRGDDIAKLAKLSDSNTSEAANIIRKNFQSDLNKTINSINNNIGEILSASDKKVSSKKILDSLEKYKSGIDSDLDPESISQIDDIINRISKKTSGGEISVNDANTIKRFLQDKASSAYRDGDLFKIGKEAANAAKSAAAETRSLIDSVEPRVTELNSKLKRIHDIEEKINNNLLIPEKSESSLMAVGTKGNPQNVQFLKELGDITGTPMVEQAENLAAMRTFANPSLLPIDTTGKSATRMGVGAGAGALVGGKIGGLVGGAMTSPMALKSVIEAGRFAAPAVKAAGKVLPSEPTREMLYKGLIQKYFESPSDKEVEQNKIPDQTSIMDKIKGSPYEEILNKAIQTGGNRSFAAANYVLKNRDENYRKLFNEEENA